VIEKWMENWHKHVRGEFPGGLDDLLAEDVVFYSPIVFSAQKGIDLTKMYLQAAGATFEAGPKAKGEAAAKPQSKFGYTKEVLSGHHAVLEFETEVGGKYVNGVDILTFNDEGKIIEFKVMIRPLQAVNLMHQQMAAMLEKLNG
jgi:hypothetical protein